MKEGGNRDSMKILFCEGSSLSAREALSALGPQNHEIVICDPNPLCICRFTMFKTTYYRSPSINDDLEAYYDFVVRIIQKEKIDILLRVHEQALLFSKRIHELSKMVKLTLPAFENYVQLFSKIQFTKLLDKLGIPHPMTIYCKDMNEVRENIFYPCFLKLDYGTASQGVWKIDNENDLDLALDTVSEAGNEYLIQENAPGVFEIAYALYDKGKLVAFHCCQRLREGAGGSSCSKIGIDRPVVRQHFEKIGKELNWHGPLAIDYFYEKIRNIPYYIDASPRLVEPMNACINGVNIPEYLVQLSNNNTSSIPVNRTAGRKNHMLMLALLYLADNNGSRKALVREVFSALRAEGIYADSVEELTNATNDFLSLVPLVFVIVKLIFSKASSGAISGSTVKNYALSYQTISKILGMKA